MPRKTYDERNIGRQLPRAWSGSTKPRPISERFFEKVSPEPNSGCWLWTGAVVTGGYGLIAQGRKTGGPIHAHRASYELFKGQVGDKYVCHACDNRACVNPDHLFLGTHQDNMDDMKAKRRSGRRPRERALKARKLTKQQIMDIRSRRLSHRKFAQLYCVDIALISRIVNRKVYGDI